MQQEMEYIYEMYRQGNIMTAAEKLYISQPALSMSIRKVEKELGMPLFDRSSRPMRLTEAGKIYIESVEKMRWLEREMEDRLAGLSELKSGVLRIGGSHYINTVILACVLTKFHQRYPGVRVELVEESSAALAEMLRRHQIDLTLSCNEMFMQEFTKYPAFCDHVLIAVPAGDPVNQKAADHMLSAADVIAGKHLSAHSVAVSPGVFENLSFILLEPGNNLYARAKQMFSDAGVDPQVALSLSQLSTAYHMAAAGFAATLTCDRMVTSPDVPLCFYLPDSPLSERTFHFITPSGSYVTHAAQELIRLFREDYAVPEVGGK
ncbi:MAG: LysR family transcriptional regulator [Lachnospiraceae bacterium]|nr:LysR family transcriptional regulator [Lachnospiraceae bacterium]